MSLLQSLHLEHLPPNHTIHVALFTSVTNALFLHKQLLDGNADFEYAFIDARIIVSRLHVLAAAFRAISDMIEGRLRSRNVHSEVVFALSPNNNISESFRRFGITPTTTTLLVLKISTPSHPFSASTVQEHLSASIEGTQVEISNDTLAAITDWEKVRKYYKLNRAPQSKALVNGAGGLGDGIKDEKKEREELQVQIIGAMALRGAA